MQKIVYSRIELSYSYLKGKQVMSLLLLCYLFEEDAGIFIELLVRYGMGLELFKDLDTLANTINRISSLVDDLRSSYLLPGEGNNVFVIMHDVVCDVVLSIASDLHGYMVLDEPSCIVFRTLQFFSRLILDWWGGNSFSFCGVDRILILENNINVLLRRTKKLALESVRDLKNVVKDLDEQEGFVHLETLELEKCDELEYVTGGELF
ncbi:hypothetical protein LguiB_005441 [Lonicera macranthoides]